MSEVSSDLRGPNSDIPHHAALIAGVGCGISASVGQALRPKGLNVGLPARNAEKVFRCSPGKSTPTYLQPMPLIRRP